MTKTFHYNCSNLSVYLEKIKKDWWLKLLQFLGQNLSKEGGTNGVGLYATTLLAVLAVENISDDHSSCGFSACTWVIPEY